VATVVHLAPQVMALRPARLRLSPALAGVTADLSGFLLEAAALGIGSLALVQPLMTLGLPVALAGAAYVSDQHMGRREWAATVVLTAGLAVFLGLATPSHGRDFAPLHRWIPVAIVTVVFVAVCLVAAALRALAEWRAPLLAVATGLVFSLSAALTKSVATYARRDLLGTLRHWELYALIVVGLISMLLGQSAFQGGHLRRSLPALTIVPPLVGTWMGWVLFHERIHATALTLPFEVAGALAAIAATVVLASSPLAEQAYAERSAPVAK